MRKRIIVGLAVLALIVSGATIFLQSNISANVVNTPQPQLLFTNAKAAAQPTTWGKDIATVKVFDGKVFSGYGDWGQIPGQSQ